VSYALRVAATNAAGSVYRDISIVFSRSVAPVINNLISGGSKQIVKNQTYSTTTPLIKVESSGAPTSYACIGTLPVGLVFNQSTGVLTGSVADNVAAGPYQVSFTATNASGTSTAVAYTLIVPIAITGPANNSSYTLTTGVNYPNIFSVTTSGLLAGAGAATVTVTGLPTGLTGSTTIQGTPTVAGTYAVTITASTTNYGSHTRTVGIVVNPAVTAYSISGRVVDAQGTGVPGVAIFAYTGKSTTTAANGTYTLPAVPTGTYNITPSFAGKTITPAYLTVTVSNTNVTGINFTST
jgi:hypothetical protein